MRFREDLVLRQIGDDYVIVEPNQGKIDYSKVFTLNETAAFLWDKLKGEDFIEEDMVQLILEYYDIPALDQDKILIDIKILISTLKDNNLLVQEV